tara:strand:- start:8192 stop:8425 length:234 start_codon:yes stop_codon:yes gene_type:complete
MPNDEKIIEKYLDEIDKLKDKVTESSEAIRGKINISKLRANPKEYIYNMSRQYFLSHEKEFRKAVKLGKKKAEGVLK